MRRKPIIPMMRLKNSFDLKKLIYENTPYGLCSFAEDIGVNPMTLVKLSKHLPVRICTARLAAKGLGQRIDFLFDPHAIAKAVTSTVMEFIDKPGFTKPKEQLS